MEHTKEDLKTVPIGKNEDVKYSSEFADEDDQEAMERAREADERQESEE